MPVRSYSPRMATPQMVPYDEFGLFHENAEEYGIAYDGPPPVRRTSVVVDEASGRRVSALVFGAAGSDPEYVFVHGGAQNAHTWDTVVLALGAPATVCVDLPGHGHSDWRDDGYDPVRNARDIAVAIRALAPNAKVVCGMSLGGLTSTVLAAEFPELVRKLVIVDVTPGVNQTKAKAIIDFVNGPPGFPDFDAIMARTVEHNPTRTVASLRRGILHNAKQLPDGSWQWRYDRRGTPESTDQPAPRRIEHDALWADVAAVQAPILLVRGSTSPVVDDADVAELMKRQPTAEVVMVEGAGHSVQGDKPLELAELIQEFVARHP
jgi:pimeloyl-ACP methyl ester carboxylesterase